MHLPALEDGGYSVLIALKELKSFSARSLLLTLAVGSLTSSVVLADDIEIYTGQGAAAGKTKVLFIIDNSGSMGDRVSVPRPYRPGHKYSWGGDGACRGLEGRIYWSAMSDSEPPECTSDAWFPVSSNRCRSAEGPLKLNSNYQDPTGRYLDRLVKAGKINGSPAWVPLEFESGKSGDGSEMGPLHVECAMDQPAADIATARDVHGETLDTDAPYITDPGNSSSWYGPAPRWTQRTWKERAQWNYLYSPHYLNYYWFHRDTKIPTKRMDVVKEALTHTLKTIPDVHAGLMEFNPNYSVKKNDGLSNGGSLRFHVTDLGVPADIETRKLPESRQRIIDAVTEMDPLGLTPLAETLFEAQRYWSGGAVMNGEYDGKEKSEGFDNRGEIYASPFESACDTSYHNILLTDGAPTRDSATDILINELIDSALLADDSAPLILSDQETGEPHCRSPQGSDTTDTDSCLDNLTEYMFKVDQIPGDELEGAQVVRTHTVGFDVEDRPELKNLLQSVADNSGGKFYLANDADGLAQQFLEILTDVQAEEGQSFTAPAISVNAQNRLVHNNELYFGLFEPALSQHWPGNVKRYRLGYDQTSGEHIVLDVNDREAVEEQTGQFKQTARSWWIPDEVSNDGNLVSLGGLAHRLFDGGDDGLSRESHVFTFAEDYDLSDFDGDSKQLIVVHSDNAYDRVENQDGVLTQEMFGVSKLDYDDFKNLVDRTRGLDVYDEDMDGSYIDGLPLMGAPLHSKPRVVTYSLDGDNQKNILISMTNDGYFHVSDTHAEDEESRLEYYAFIPRNLLKNVPELIGNRGAGDIVYGLDGGLTVWRYDHNDDGNIDADKGDHVYAYFGMRRGGRAVYALDVTSLEAPKLLWYINPDDPNHVDEESESPFRLMGQSWAAPVRTRMLVGSTIDDLAIKDVIIISGGYDPISQDGRNSDIDIRNPDGDLVGHALFIVDARTGELYWWASRDVDGIDDNLQMDDTYTTDMRWGVTAPVTVVDTNGDDIAEMFFVTDNGGQIWRFDIDNQVVMAEGNDPASMGFGLADRISGGKILDAQLHDSQDQASPENNRRFYYAVDVALVALEGKDPYLSLAVGTGYRAHPLNRVIHDRFYVIKDPNVKGPPLNHESGDIEYTTLYESDLLDVTNLNFANQDTAITMDEQSDLVRGWFITPGGNPTGEESERENTGANAKWTYEKVLASSVTFSGNIIFTTYRPPEDALDPDTCQPNYGTGAAYIVRFDDARPVVNIDDPTSEGDYVAQQDGGLNLADRRFALSATGIPSAPWVVFTEGPNGTVAKPFSGWEGMPIEEEIIPRPIYWYQEGIR